MTREGEVTFKVCSAFSFNASTFVAGQLDFALLGCKDMPSACMFVCDITELKGPRCNPDSEENMKSSQGRRCEVTDPTAIAPALIIAHEIDEASPLHGLMPEDIHAAEGAIFVSVAATDDNSKQVAYISFSIQGFFCPANIKTRRWDCSIAFWEMSGGQS